MLHISPQCTVVQQKHSNEQNCTLCVCIHYTFSIILQTTHQDYKEL